MDETLRIGIRVLFAYVVLHQLFRHAGHRVVASGTGGIGKGSGIELVLTVVIGDLIDDLLWADVPAAQFVAAAGTLTALHLGIGLMRRADTWWWKLLDGTPTSLLQSGTPQRAAMRAHRVNESELTALLRREGMDRDRWSEIRAAYLENSGRLSLLRHSWAKPATHADREQARKATS